MLEHIASIIGALAWPSALLFIALIFRHEFKALFAGLSKGRRNLRLKYGSFELETKFVEKIEQHLKKIAEEPNPDKRQELASLKVALDISLESVKPEAKRMLNWLAENQLTDCTHINWYQPPEGFKYDSIKQLSQYGLIQVLPMYDGDELIRIHPVVKEYAFTKKNEEHNKAN
jgi:hypothetical protein